THRPCVLQHSACRYIVTPFEQDQRQERPKRWYWRNSGIADAACQPNDDFLAVLRDYIFTRRLVQTVTLGQSRFFDTPRRSHKIASNEWRTGLFPGPATDRMDVRTASGLAGQTVWSDWRRIPTERSKRTTAISTMTRAIPSSALRLTATIKAIAQKQAATK